MKIENIPQYCPKCGHKIMSWNGITLQPISVKCKTCNKLAVFYPMTKKVLLKDLPDREQTSGMRFY